MQLSDAIRKKISNLLIEHHQKPFELARNAGIALPTLLDFLKGDTKNLRVDTLLHICEGFNITLEEFFSDSLFKDVMSE